MQRPTGVLPTWRLRERAGQRLSDVDVVIDLWRSASAESVWTYTGDWWTPAVEALVEAVLEERDSAPAAGELGRQRAAAGVDMAETIDDVAVLFDRVLECEQPVLVVRALAVGWYEVAGGALVEASCEDPLLRLTTRRYLRTRLGEVYRQASSDGAGVPETAALVVVETRGGDGWTLLAERLSVSEILRTVFSGGETFCALNPLRTAVLVRRDTWLGKRVSLLRGMLGDAGAEPARTWVEALPPGLSAALRLVDELSR